MSRLNERDESLLLSGKNIDFQSTEYSYLNGEFGKDASDYVEILIHDEEENFLESGVVDPVDYNVEVTGVRLNTGTILRKFGYDRGRFVVKYNFFRKIAGSFENLIIDEDDLVLEPDTELVVDESTGKITSGDTGGEVFVKENKYKIHEISPSRTELRLVTQNIRDRKYISEFFNLQRNKKLISSNIEGFEPLGNVEFFVDDNSDVGKEDSNKIKLPIPATQNMVGGYFYLNDVYNTDITKEPPPQDTGVNQSKADYQGS